MLSAADLTSMQSTLNAAVLATICTQSRAGALLSPQPTMPDGTALRCRLAADTRELHVLGSSPYSGLQRWKILLPYGIDVRIGDRLTAFGNVYAVVEVFAPTTFSVAVACMCYQLYDATGAAVWIQPNATVQGSRMVAGTLDVFYASREVSINDPHSELELVTPAGGKLSRFLLDDPAALWAYGDTVTILGQGADGVVPDVTAYQIIGLRIVGDEAIQTLRCVLAGGR